MKKFFILLLFIFSLIKFSYADESYTVNIPTSNGAYKTIVLTRSGDTYIGPQGEHYGHFPTVVELQTIYGTGTTNATVPVPVSTLPSYTPLSEDQRARMTDQQISDFNARMQKEAIERQKDQESMQQAVKQRQELDQQMQRGADETAANQKRMEQQSQQILIDQKKAADEVLHPRYTPVQQKKIDQDWFILGWFAGTLLFIALGFLAFILLLHIPNRLFGPDHPINDLPLSVAVRQGMTKAQFNKSVSNILIWEILIVAILVGVGFKSLVAFGAALIILFILMGIKTSAFIFIYIFSVYWMMVAAEIAYAVCGGQLTTMGNYVSAWVGGYIFAVLGFAMAWGIHTAGLQYLDDISS